MIHLDTSFLIRALDSGSPEDRKLREWVGASETLSMSTVAWAEFLCGPIGGTELELATRVVGRRHDFTQENAVTAAHLFNESGRRRGTLIDCMIAASAVADGARIATANEADFRRFAKSGLEMAQGVTVAASGVKSGQ